MKEPHEGPVTVTLKPPLLSPTQHLCWVR